MKDKTVGKRIALARTRKGWSQSELARAIDVVPATICILEGGKGSSKHLPAIARALGVSADWLDTGKGPQGSIAQTDARAMLAALKSLDAMLGMKPTFTKEEVADLRGIAQSAIARGEREKQ